MQDYYSLLILLVIYRSQSCVELTVNLLLVRFTFLMLILTFFEQRFYVNYHMKVEAIIGKNDEAIMNFEKVKTSLVCEDALYTLDLETIDRGY